MKVKRKYQINKKCNMKRIEKKNKRCIQIRDLDISFVELQNKLQALEEKIKINDSEEQ